jgi:hypothetical protein
MKTDEAVAQTQYNVLTLRKQGRVVGPFNLRLELGRGSYSTIGRHIRQLALTHTGLRRRRLCREPPEP